MRFAIYGRTIRRNSLREPAHCQSLALIDPLSAGFQFSAHCEAAARSSTSLLKEALAFTGDSPSNSLLLIVRGDPEHPCHAHMKLLADRPVTLSDIELVFINKL
ncbi:hypothetical protein R3I93_005191 [Phoxinus phoxinus]|uniref:Uncharacterized protein n=1 Tax=Phoxinus phoxinus TaxID=58324 RepID=A0AAN9HCE2_9TELE